MVGFAAQPLMELEVESLTGAAHGERSPGLDQFTATAIASDWETRADAVELRIPTNRSRRWA
jgi:putative transposase